MNRIAILAAVVLGACIASLGQETRLDPEKVFSYDASKPLNYREAETKTLPGGERIIEISYDSAKIGLVPGYLVLPRGKGPFAAIIYMHWEQGNKGEFLEKVAAAVKKLKERSLVSPYLRAFVVARINPLRWIKGEPPSLEEVLKTMRERAAKFNVEKIKPQDLAGVAGPPDEEG